MSYALGLSLVLGTGQNNYQQKRHQNDYQQKCAFMKVVMAGDDEDYDYIVNQILTVVQTSMEKPCLSTTPLLLTLCEVS